jgi:hypothetical protein
VLVMPGLSDPADREHLRVLRELRRAGLDPTVLSLTTNEPAPGCALCLAPDHQADQCPAAPGGQQAHLFA